MTYAETRIYKGLALYEATYPSLEKTSLTGPNESINKVKTSKIIINSDIKYQAVKIFAPGNP